MIEIIPAIVPQKFKDLEDKISAIVGMAETVQVDICDGKFTSDKNWPFVNGNEKFKKLAEKKEELPYEKEIDYEIHLMTKTPNDEVFDWANAGAERILVPIETASDSVLEILNEWGNVAEIGLVANIETSVEIFEAFFDKVKTIQLMSISVIGHQGEPFNEKVFGKIRRLREIGYKHQISVDGGVSLENAKKIIEAGANRLIVGSAIWKSDSPVETLRKFQQITDDK